MKKLILVVAVGLMLITACKKDDNDSATIETNQLLGNWYADTLYHVRDNGRLMVFLDSAYIKIENDSLQSNFTSLDKWYGYTRSNDSLKIYELSRNLRASEVTIDWITDDEAIFTFYEHVDYKSRFKKQ